MRNRRWDLASAAACVFLLLVAGLAGCVGSSREALGGAAPVDSEFGEIHVLVTDDELVPLQGARVEVQGAGAFNFTGADGRLALQVTPGSYKVRVESYGHESALRETDVGAGSIVEVVVVLVAVPAKVPFTEVKMFAGTSSCTVPLLWGIFDLSDACASAAKSAHLFAVKPNADWAFLVQELSWKGSYWFTMFTDNAVPQTVTLKHLSIRHGPSPIRVMAYPGQVALKHDAQHFEPYPAKNTSLHIRSMFAGYFGESLRPIGSQCNVGHDAGCMGVGTAVEARYESYASWFYHEAPANPEKYSAIPDQ